MTKKALKRIEKPLVMLLTGGIVYFYFEILMRGYSHISMFVLGGICFFIVGEIGNCFMRLDCSFLLKLLLVMVSASTIITALELLTGMIVNINMNLKVWDYSQMKYNYKGQICLLYSGLWALMGLPCVFFYGMIDKFVLEGRHNKSQA